MAKQVRSSGKKHWQVLCPKCDGWHYVRVRVQAELLVSPGVQVQRRWLSDPLCVCAGCEQDVEFLLTPAEIETIVDLAYST